MQEDEYIIEDSYDPQSRFNDINKFEPKFWENKKLEELSKPEWELLCDGCGKCCLNKLEIKGKICFTNTYCRFLDPESCLCKIYENRLQKVNDCRDIDINAVREKPRWLPKTCAYVLLDEGKPLPDWHPLITGKAASVHEAGFSLKSRKLINESEVVDYENHIVKWEDL
jgi:uncharacterized cysteine cluster protein YcgN (CxxCxxCC family)